MDLTKGFRSSPVKRHLVFGAGLICRVPIQILKELGEGRIPCLIPLRVRVGKNVLYDLGPPVDRSFPN